VTLEELPAYLEAIAVRAGYAAIPAADVMGADLRDAVKKRLTEMSHARGTRTPAPPGGPPAMESGDLAGSVKMYPASTPVVATAKVGPNMPPRDAVNEFGMSGIRPVRAKYMRFYYDGLVLAKVVNVPQREYMESTAEIVAHDGSLAAATAAAFYAALWG
jgi:hypothetical protein